MQKKKYQIKSTFLSKMNFDFVGEKIWLQMEGQRKLNQKLSIDDIEFEKISDVDTYVTFGVKFSGAIESEDGEKEIFNAHAVYSAIFLTSGFSDEEMEMLINVNCASFIYPYIRAEIVKVLSETNLPKVNLPPIDFVSLYHNKKQQLATKGQEEKLQQN